MQHEIGGLGGELKFARDGLSDRIAKGTERWILDAHIEAHVFGICDGVDRERAEFSFDLAFGEVVDVLGMMRAGYHVGVGCQDDACAVDGTIREVIEGLIEQGTCRLDRSGSTE